MLKKEKKKKTCSDRFGERFRLTKFFAGWETEIQSFPQYLAGSWNFAHNHPGSAEHLSFPAKTLRTPQKCFISVFLDVFCLLLLLLLLCILEIIFVGCPCRFQDSEASNLNEALIAKK